MIIKICGIASVEMAQAAQDYGADYIGFVFADSKRKIDLPTARAIVTAVPAIGRIGVFVDSPLAEVKDIARKLSLSYVQLHGNESAEYCQAVGVPAIKAFRGDLAINAAMLNDFPASWILFDSFSDNQFGGTGHHFDWRAMEHVRMKLQKPLFIAGGLHSGNIQTAIQVLRPDGVDVSSGVEIAGRKSQEKIKEFIAAAREGERCYA